MSGANILTSLVRLKNARDSSFDRSRQAHKNPAESAQNYVGREIAIKSALEG
jgi:hypothetical protein